MDKTLTYNKLLTQEAAMRAAAYHKAARAEKMKTWQAMAPGYRFLSEWFGSGEPDRYRWHEIDVAERVEFKAKNATEATVSLTDTEIDVIKNFWDLKDWS